MLRSTVLNTSTIVSQTLTLLYLHVPLLILLLQSDDDAADHDARQYEVGSHGQSLDVL